MDGSAPLAPHTRLGPYEILMPIGAGGMGRVYKARDTRLDRIVAIKVSLERFSERFEREARSVAALSHPHICVLYDVGENYLVMEYVDGHPLKGPIPVAEALRLAGQLAGALDHAHRHGIIHRDLKPGNILVAKSGVKLLDFGLAALLAKPKPAPSDSTLTPPLTEKGTVMGTPQYMAPEQLEGKPADARTDIFAAGVVLYELISGKRPFEGQSHAALSSAILSAEAGPLPMAPPALDRIIRTCLAKDPDDRWQSARDLLHALEWPGETAIAVTPAKPPILPWIVAACLASILLVFAMLPRKAETGRAARFQIQPPESNYFFDSVQEISPDGSQILLSAKRDAGAPEEILALRSLDSLAIRMLSGTEGANHPVWSPDSKQVAFFTAQGLKKVDVAGGGVKTLSTFPGAQSPAGGSWSPDGSSILYSVDGRIQLYPADGGPPRAVTQLDPALGVHVRPQYLPDGRRFLYLALGGRPENTGIFLGALDSTEKRFVLKSNYPVKYTPGFLLFVQGTTLMVHSVDDTILRFSGQPVALAMPNLASITNYAPAAAYSISEEILVFREAEESIRMVWYTSTGAELGTLGDLGQFSNPTLSRDGRQLAVGRVDPAIGTRDIWVFDLIRGSSSRLTFDPSDDFNPLWAPDGSRIAFSSNRKGVRDIYWKRLNRAGKEELLLESGAAKSLEDWLMNGALLLNSGSDLWTFFPDGNHKLVAVVATEKGQDQGKYSPDGRWLAYRSNETGSGEIYVQGRAAGNQWRISTSGGSEPAWRGDGKELYFLNGTKMMAVEVKTAGGAFQAGPPRLLFQAPFTGETRRNRYVVTADGKKFLTLVKKTEKTSVHVVMNWRALLKK